MFARLDVEVVDRLVEQQQVAAAQHQSRQLQSTTLTQRAGPNALEDTFAIEEESGQKAACVLLAHGALAENGLNPWVAGLMPDTVVFALGLAQTRQLVHTGVGKRP